MPSHTRVSAVRDLNSVMSGNQLVLLRDVTYGIAKARLAFFVSTSQVV